MAIDFAKPATTDNYSTQFVPGIQGNVTALAQWLDSTQTTITGAPPSYAKRYNRASGQIEEYDGSTWAALPKLGATTVASKSDADGLVAQLASATGVSGLRINNQAGTRKIELLVSGASATAPYGSAAGNAVLNIAAGSLYIAMGDSAKLLVTSAGDLRPNATGTQLCGSTSFRWSGVNSVLGNFSGLLTASGGITGNLTGNVTGDVTGNCSGSAGRITGNTINGVTFTGLAPITVPAAASTLTGTTLAAGVVNSSLTKVGAGCDDGTYELGYKDVPQLSKSASYTLVLGDRGKTIYHPASDATARTWTIPANASVAFPIGSVVCLDNEFGAGAITIAINTDTLVMDGSGATGSRTLAAGGIATARKVTATRWRIGGTGLT